MQSSNLFFKLTRGTKCECCTLRIKYFFSGYGAFTLTETETDTETDEIK